MDRQAGTVLLRRMVQVRVRTLSRQETEEGEAYTGIMSITFEDAEILPFKFEALASGTQVLDFQPRKAVSGSGAEGLLGFYRAVFEEALQTGGDRL